VLEYGDGGTSQVKFNRGKGFLSPCLHASVRWYAQTTAPLHCAQTFFRPPSPPYLPHNMGKKRSAPAPDVAKPATMRLHIAPLTAETAASILPAGTDLGTISYHATPTFPENAYGFVDLPTAAAEKLKKKLHGAIFRGVKVRVEEARPEEWKERLAKEQETKEERRERKEQKKRKREDGVLEGMLLDPARRIARGWVDKEKKERKEKTEAKDKDGKKKEKKEKKKVDRSECLFKAAIPANKVDLIKEKPKKEKKSKEEKALEKAAKKDKKTRKVIREFENLEKFPAFLKSSQLDDTRGPSDFVGEFVDGVGWVDGKGNVVEEPPKKKHKKDKKKEQADKEVTKVPKEATPEPEVSETPKVVDFDEDSAPAPDAMDIDDAASVSSEEVFFDVPEVSAQDTPVVGAEQDESDKDSEADKAKEKVTEAKQTTPVPVEEKEASSESEPESETEAEDSSEDEESAEEVEAAEDKVFASQQDDSSDSGSSDDEDEDEDEAEPKASPSKEKPTLAPIVTEVHPLEALYKPSTADTTESSTTAATGTFKFGFSSGGGNDSEDEDDGIAQTRTPSRDPGRYRSSAPTPDTAIGTKRFFSPTSASEESASESTAPTTSVAPFLGAVDAPLLFNHEESRFLKGMSLWQKLPQPKALLPGEEQEQAEGEAITDPVELWKKRFYDNRGEWNREWKRRRKEGLKAKRKRERAGPSGANRV
jgi:hypothetical protein